MKRLWFLFVLSVALLMVSCEKKDGEIINSSIIRTDREIVPAENERSSFLEKELKQEKIKPAIKETPLEVLLQQPVEIKEKGDLLDNEEIVSIYDKVNAKAIHHATLIALVEEGINQIRKEQGLSILGNRRNLKDAATIQNDYCTRISGLTHKHEQIKYANIRDRVANYGGRYSTVGENIQYYGFLNNEINGEVFLFPPDYQEAAKDIVANWVDSPGHYKNIVNSDFRSFGTAVGWNDQLHAIFVTQVYGG